MENKDRRNDLTEGVVWKKLLGFFFPILLGLLFQQLYNTADAVVVGRFIGDAALAAVGGGPASIINMILGFFLGLNCGATVLIAQRFGADDHEDLSRVLHTSIVFCCVIGLIITVAGYFWAPAALRLIHNPEDIMDDSVRYLRIYFTGAIPMLLYNLFQGTFQSVGDSRRPLFYLIISCLTNILLDVLFVAVLKLGVAGAGWASVLSMVMCTVLALTRLMRIDGPHKVRIDGLTLNPDILQRTMKVGLPAGLEGSMYNIAGLIIQAAVNDFGTDTVAAWTSTGKLDGFFWVTSNAFGVAICAFVGQCYGAGKVDRMRQAIRICLKISICVTLVMSVILMAIARPVYGLFLQNPEVIQKAIEIMWYFVPFYFIWMFVEVLSGAFRGVGDTLRPMIITMLGTCVFRVLWVAFIVPMNRTIPIVSIEYVISWVITGSAFVVYYKKGCWLKYGIAPHGNV